MINGIAHGPQRGTTVCQLHMRHFKDGDELYLEPWRARGLPGDQRPDRRPQRLRPHHHGRRLYHGAYRQRARRQRYARSQGRCRIAPWTRRPASAAEPAWRPAPTPRACCSREPKSRHLGLLPQGQAGALAPRPAHGRADERRSCFGSCTNIGECEAVCPKEIRWKSSPA